MTVSLGQIRDRLATAGLLVDEAIASPGADASEAGSIPVSSVTLDSREARVGSLFCAVRGTVADSHEFLAAASRAGAVAALVESPVDTVDMPQIQVLDGRRAAACAAAEFYGDPWTGLTLIGITGTNGKTTSAAILRHLLSARGAAASVGTLGVVGPDGEVLPGTEGLTTPSGVDVAAWLARLRDSGVDAVAMEVSSHALHQGRAAAARFDAALLTNLSRDHLDYHESFAEYRAAKLRLLESLKPTGAVVLNADDEAWKGVEAPGHRVVRFSIEGRGDVNADDIRAGGAGMEWRLRVPGGAAAVRMSLFGLFNVANAVGAAATLWSLGWKLEDIAAGLGTLPQVPGRLERVPLPAYAPAVVIDFAHTPEALAGAIGALRPLTRGRLFVVFGAGGGRDVGKRPEMGRVAADLADVAIVTSDNPRDEDPERIIDDIESGMNDAPRQRVPDRRAAIKAALQQAEEGDVVLLAGKGHERYQIVGTEKQPFDERETVRDLFRDMED